MDKALKVIYKKRKKTLNEITNLERKICAMENSIKMYEKKAGDNYICSTRIICLNKKIRDMKCEIDRMRRRIE